MSRLLYQSLLDCSIRVFRFSYDMLIDLSTSHTPRPNSTYYAAIVPDAFRYLYTYYAKTYAGLTGLGLHISASV